MGSWSADPSSAPTSASSRLGGGRTPRAPPPGARRAAATRCRAARRPGRSSRERRADRGQRVQLAAEIAKQRPPLVGKRRGEPRRRVERLRDLEEVGRIEPAAAGGALDPRPDVVRRPDPDPRPSSSSARAWSVSSRPRATITGSLDGSSSASRRDGPNWVRSARRSRTCGNSRSDRAAVHRSGRASAQGGRPGRRGMARDHEPPRGRSTAHRRRRCRSAAARMDGA